MNLNLDFLDFPTAWAIQRRGVEHTDSRCSAVQAGGAMLCDCGAIEAEWRRLHSLVASDGSDQEDERG